MKHQTLGFIGGGRVTRILLDRWQKTNSLPASVVVSDTNPDTLAKLKERFPGIETVPNGNGAAASQDVVVIAVHPPVLAEILPSLREHLKADAIVVSLAPKFTIARISESLGGFNRVVRVIPNAPSRIGQGFNPLAFAANLGSGDKTRVTALLAPLGECPEVAEEKLEGYAVLTAMGPTYLWFQLQVLREVAAGFGLNKAETDTALSAMVRGATATLLDATVTPAEVMDLVPVKPLAELEPQITEAYSARLTAIYQKIKP